MSILLVKYEIQKNVTKKCVGRRAPPGPATASGAGADAAEDGEEAAEEGGEEEPGAAARGVEAREATMGGY